MSPASYTTTVPPDVSYCIVGAMRSTTNIFRMGKTIINYMKQLPGIVIHIVFDVYEEGHLKSLSKGREIKSRREKLPT